uniref:Uncharacterized protein n=1 Tax=Meleagris gallopavo TaxID=9103 RepID=G1NJY3_MELGA
NQPPKSIYICDGDIFKKLDSELSRAQEQTLDTSYVILPTNTSTLRAKPPKDESKYSINIDQMPQTRLIHLSMATDPGFVVKSPPREPVTMTCSEVQGSPMIQQQQQLPPQNIPSESQIPNSLCDTGDSGNSGVVSKSETVSTLSMSSLERRKSRYAELDFEKIMHTRKRHQDMFQDLNRKLQHAEKEKESPTTDSKVSHISLEPSPPGDTLVPAGAWEHLGAVPECLTLSSVYIATNTCTTLDMESHKGTTSLSTK